MKNCSDLPEDALIEILSRLSVKSLLRLKCVCKSWYSLIKSPSFISKHLQQTNLDDHRKRFIVMHRDMITLEDLFTSFTRMTSLEDQEGAEQLRTQSKRQSFIQTMGPCNGIFCVFDYFQDLFLWNPATREIKDIPKSCIPPPPDLDTAYSVCGFGFDSKTNDYKVIRLGCRRPRRQGFSLRNPEYHHIELYKLNTNCWRRIDEVIPGLVWGRYERAMYMNGVFHWWADLPQDKVAIISFDMVDETFQLTPLPEWWQHLTIGYLTEWNESLHVIRSIHSETDEPYLEIWEMSEYGSNVNWTKQLTVGPVIGHEIPLGYWNNFEFIFAKGGAQFASYNMKTQAIKALTAEAEDPPETTLGAIIKVVAYQESLVSCSGL